MKLPLDSGEFFIKEGAANLQRGMETVGGHLYLTNFRLIFEPHAINIQRKTEIVPVAAVQCLKPCRTKFLDLIPLTDNSMAVFTHPGQEFRFVLYSRDSWISEIEKLLTHANA